MGGVWDVFHDGTLFIPCLHDNVSTVGTISPGTISVKSAFFIFTNILRLGRKHYFSR